MLYVSRNMNNTKRYCLILLFINFKSPYAQYLHVTLYHYPHTYFKDTGISMSCSHEKTKRSEEVDRGWNDLFFLKWLFVSSNLTYPAASGLKVKLLVITQLTTRLFINYLTHLSLELGWLIIFEPSQTNFESWVGSFRVWNNSTHVSLNYGFSEI